MKIVWTIAAIVSYLLVKRKQPQTVGPRIARPLFFRFPHRRG